MEQWALPYIIGGDFNTILDRSLGEGNLDREGLGRVPNARNSEAIGHWIEHGDCIEPFRALYPEQKETSFMYIPFRGGRAGGVNYSRSRLDFFLIKRELIELVKKVKYEDRLGNDFDHKMVTLTIGKCGGVIGQVKIYNNTLEHKLSKTIGDAYILDTINNHLRVREEEVTNRIGIILGRIDEYHLDVERMGYMQNNVDGIQFRLSELFGRIEEEKEALPNIDELLSKEFGCDWSNLYEAVTSCLKIKLLELKK